MTDSRPLPPPEHWDEDRAAETLGRTLLVGITERNHHGAVIRRRQVFGTVTFADRLRGICVRNEQDGSDFWLPPDIRSIEDADPGVYRNRTTGEVVEDPDFVTSWTFTQAPPIQ